MREASCCTRNTGTKETGATLYKVLALKVYKCSRWLDTRSFLGSSLLRPQPQEDLMNATASNRTLLAHITRLAHVALLALALLMVTPGISAAVDERSPALTASAVMSPTARDDCIAGRHRTGTSAFRLGIDPAPTCDVLFPRGLLP
jgi:hypothetical protein